MATLKIGQVAAQAGVGIDTIRYYERRGILSAAPRRESGYRAFDESAVAQLKLVKELQGFGLQLDEVEEIFRAIANHGQSCTRDRKRLEAALARTEEKLHQLKSLRARLQGALQSCDAGTCRLLAKNSLLLKQADGRRAHRGRSAGATRA